MPFTHLMLNNSMIEKFCQQCNKEFTVKPGSYGKFCSLSCGTIFRSIKQKELRIDTYESNPSICKHCKSPLSYDQRHNKYCSHSCSAFATNNVIRKRGPIPKEKHPFCTVEFILCSKTNKWYSNRNSNGSIRKVSPYVKTEKEKYYQAARFRFNVYQFPEKFDLDLVNNHGWYSCPGKKRKRSAKNINGVSRDHLMSVSYGFKNNIDPAIISHPANCQIVLHSENKRKAESCKITLEELLDRIKNW